jgi:hypothetical protein
VVFNLAQMINLRDPFEYRSINELFESISKKNTIPIKRAFSKDVLELLNRMLAKVWCCSYQVNIRNILFLPISEAFPPPLRCGYPEPPIGAGLHRRVRCRGLRRAPPCHPCAPRLLYQVRKESECSKGEVLRAKPCHLSVCPFFVGLKWVVGRA